MGGANSRAYNNRKKRRKITVDFTCGLITSKKNKPPKEREKETLGIQIQGKIAPFIGPCTDFVLVFFGSD